jgi:hypothetical protein
MTQEEEKLIQERQAAMLTLQKELLTQTKRLTYLYVLIFFTGVAIALILFLNRVTTTTNGDKLDRLIEAVKEQK